MALLPSKPLRSFIGRNFSPVSAALLFFSTSSNDSNLKTLISVYDLSPEAAFKLPLHIKSSPEKVYALISLLKDSGFSQSQIEKTICSPKLHAFKVETIQQKLKDYRDLGFEPSEIAETVSSDSRLLLGRTERLISATSVAALTKVLGYFPNASAFKLCSWGLRADLNKTLLPNIELLKQCGVNSEQIARYVAHSPRFKLCSWGLRADLNKTLLPNVELLKQYGVNSEQIARYVAHSSRFLLHEPKKMQKFVEMVDRMGIPRGRFLPAIKTLSSMSSENWEGKWNLFRSLGFSEDGILDVFRRSPQVLAVSDKKIRDVWTFMSGFETDCVSVFMNRPQIFLLSIEKRLKPRLEVYQILESRNLLKKKKMKLVTFFSLSDKQFLEFMSQYTDELGDELAALKVSRAQSRGT